MSVERRGPAICNVSNIGEGKDEMTKASSDLQDLRRRLYVKRRLNRPGGSEDLLRNERASAGNDGIGSGCTTLKGCLTPIECDATGRKSPQQDRSHKLWREANGGAQCGKSARCVRREGGLETWCGSGPRATSARQPSTLPSAGSSRTGRFPASGSRTKLHAFTHGTSCMAALTQACAREESPCQLGAIHTWHFSDLAPCQTWVRYALPAQSVDATQTLNLSAGVSNCKVSRGRSFS